MTFLKSEKAHGKTDRATTIKDYVNDCCMILVYTEQKFEITDTYQNVVEQHADITAFYREGIKMITRNTFTIYTRFHTGPAEKTVEITPEVVNFVTNLVKDAM